MDDSSAQLGGVTNSSSQLGGNGGNSIGLNKQSDGSHNANSHEQIYTIPGVLHFIQHEFSRFEIERSQWDVDRAELQAKIAVLLGERKGQESLKSDLIRRIKMLEYALVQERAKSHRMKYGCDPPSINEVSAPADEPNITNEVAPDSEAPFSSVSNVTWRQGRQLLRSYLQEIGYTDTIIDVRSTRVRSLLGLTNGSEQEENINPNVIANEGTKRASDSQGRRTPAKKPQQASMAEAMILDSEAAVMANFEFLGNADVEMSDEDGISDDLDMVVGDESDVKTTKRKAKGITMHDDVDAEAEEVLNELNSITDVAGPSSNAPGKTFPNDVRRSLGGVKDDDIDASLGLGELAQLTVNNDAEAASASYARDANYRKTWNAKYTLRSHFDGVRALVFHPQDSVLVTASEDHTLKLWNLHKITPTKKTAGQQSDIEPLYTFRAHTSPVLCLAMSTNGEQCFSGGLDGTIICWNIPGANIDPYDSYDESVLHSMLASHTDAVWGLAVNPENGHLASCSADGTIKIWSPKILLNTITGDVDGGTPTSIDFVRDEPDRIVVAYNTGTCIIYDTESGESVVKLDTTQEANGIGGKFIYKVVCHPTLSITITAHEDRHIRFWDNTNGSMLHSMVAHLEPVTSLAIDAHGLYLLSGSHDCSIRLWNFDNKTCVQEITAHRKKFDESIFDVAFHPSRPYIASAGADALAKVFV